MADGGTDGTVTAKDKAAARATDDVNIAITKLMYFGRQPQPLFATSPTEHLDLDALCGNVAKGNEGCGEANSAEERGGGGVNGAVRGVARSVSRGVLRAFSRGRTRGDAHEGKTNENTKSECADDDCAKGGNQQSARELIEASVRSYFACSGPRGPEHCSTESRTPCTPDAATPLQNISIL